jgi:broad specificity phosphatase PhoE
MPRIILLRHAHSIANEKGILAGRAPNISLSKQGHEERERLIERLNGAVFDQIISSPMQRCIETIEKFEKKPAIVKAFQEVDYGDWTGKKMSSLARKKEWRQIHSSPTNVRFPNGETLPEVQVRVLKGVTDFINTKSKNVLLVTHADVIKVLVLHALGTHIDKIDKLHINNASISILDFHDNDYRVIRVNDDSSKVSELLLRK